MSEEVTPPHAPSDPVEMRRLMYQTPAMVSHPPIPVSMLAQHIEMLKANDNLKFSQEYEVRILTYTHFWSERVLKSETVLSTFLSTNI